MIARSAGLQRLLMTPGARPRVFSITTVAVIVGTFLLGARAPGAPFDIATPDLLPVVLLVAGIMVAVALPTLLLAALMLSQSEGAMTGAGQRGAAALRKIVLLALASFVIGLLAYMGLGRGVSWSPAFVVQDLIAGLATALLLAAVLWFIPLVRALMEAGRAASSPGG